MPDPRRIDLDADHWIEVGTGPRRWGLYKRIDAWPHRSVVHLCPTKKLAVAIYRVRTAPIAEADAAAAVLFEIARKLDKRDGLRTPGMWALARHWPHRRPPSGHDPEAWASAVRAAWGLS